jgi:hypothetical protein
VRCRQHRSYYNAPSAPLLLFVERTVQYITIEQQFAANVEGSKAGLVQDSLHEYG